MRLMEKSDDSFAIELTRDELRILANAVNEVCNGPEAIEGPEFDTRMGATREEAEALLDALNKAR
jgi:hypothetical protein